MYPAARSLCDSWASCFACLNLINGDGEQSGPSWHMSSSRQPFINGVVSSSRSIMRVLYTFSCKSNFHYVAFSSKTTVSLWVTRWIQECKNNNTAVVWHFRANTHWKIFRKALFHATSTHFSSHRLKLQVSQLYSREGRQYVCIRYSADISFQTIPRTPPSSGLKSGKLGGHS